MELKSLLDSQLNELTEQKRLEKCDQLSIDEQERNENKQKLADDRALVQAIKVREKNQMFQDMEQRNYFQSMLPRHVDSDIVLKL